jgi:hypothetical protein
MRRVLTRQQLYEKIWERARHVPLKTQAAEPAVSQVEVHLLAQAALRSNAEAVAHDQHPQHQLGIDRGRPIPL